MVNFKNQVRKGKIVPPVKKTKSPAAKTEKKSAKKRITELILLLAVVVITAIAFGPTLNNQFIETWDDGVYVTDNISITKLNKENLDTWFTTSINGTYVPIPLLSLALEYHFFKLDPRPYHVNNLILHLLCTILVFYFLSLLGLNPWFAAFAALLFGIHPMRVESVAWVTERKDLLFSLFYLSALVSYIFYITRIEKKKLFYTLTLVFFVLSLFSKIQAVTLPLSMLLLDYFFKRPLKVKLLLEKIPHFALSLGFGLAGIFILEKTGSLEINLAYSLMERAFFGLHTLLIYIVKVFYPAPLSVFYPYPMSPGNTLPWFYYISPLILLGLAVLVFFTRKKNRAVIFGSLFFLFNVMFLLQILGAGQAFMADRFTYIPYLGFFFLAAWAGQYLYEKNKNLLIAIGAVMIILPSIYLVMTRERSKIWKNSETLWTDVIEKFPKKIPTAYANRASYYRKDNQWPKATEDYNLAVSLDPKNAVSIMNRGNLLFDQGNLDAAFADYMKALSLKGSSLEMDKLYANLGAIFGKRQQLDSALYYLDLSIALNSTFPNAYLNRGLIHDGRTQFEKAILDYKKYLELVPGDDRVYTSVGVSYQNLKNYQESLKWFTEGIRLNPRGSVHYMNRSLSYNNLGDKENASKDAVKAKELGYAVNPDYLRLLGINP